MVSVREDSEELTLSLNGKAIYNVKLSSSQAEACLKELESDAQKPMSVVISI